MSVSKVTNKYQVTIPKEVRKQTGIQPGEIVTIEALNESEIIIRRFPKVKDPLRILIENKPLFKEHIPLEKIEEKAEER